MNYTDLNDYEILNLISEDNEDATELMYTKYQPLITKTAKKFLKYTKGSGLELNDLVQEGMIGLNKAIDTYQDTKEASFYTYAKNCIEKKLISQTIAAKRLKHQALNNAVSIDATFENSTASLSDFIKDERVDLEAKVLSNEYIQDILDKLEKILTDFEMQIFELKINGFTNKEIADLLDKEQKQIDNAYTRARKKLNNQIKSI